MNKKIRLFNLLLIFTLLLSACNLPTNNPEEARATAAAQTIEAVMSFTPASPSPPHISFIRPRPPCRSAASARATGFTVAGGTSALRGPRDREGGAAISY